ncbi:MAG: hypothetical protein N3D09_02270 [Archaeoglobaceae archaeon]|nr:hypothetical protein [Archaeoglobaceae archaeon]
MYSVKIIFLSLAILLSFFHWAGIIVAGTMVGFMTKSYKKALLYSFLLVLALWVIFLIYSAIFGAHEKLLTFPLTYAGLLLTSFFAMVSSLLRAFK